MSNKLKQLIPGNPGTSFVVALLYLVRQKYHIRIENEDQLLIFVRGIVKSRKVFFSGVINEIAHKYKLKSDIFSNSQFIIKQAQDEIDDKYVSLSVNKLDVTSVKELLSKYEYVVLSVDIFQFLSYHDYHFVCLSKESNSYKIFEPKSGQIQIMDVDRTTELILSVRTGLNDILLCFCM